jgi:hypothetical protein
MNIYEKIQLIKKELLEANLKKTGENKFAGFKYYELADFLPTIINLCNEHKVFTRVSFNNEEATLEVRNIEEPSEVIVYTSPMEQLELKGCNKVQALGGTETYNRRYLYQACFDIIENDMFDSVSNIENMTKEEAEKYTINFGKHKGKLLIDLVKEENPYIDWLLNNSNNQEVLKAIELLTGRTPKTEEEWDERIELDKKLQEIIVAKDLDVEAICKYYKVARTTELSDEQIKEIIEKRG